MRRTREFNFGAQKALVTWVGDFGDGTPAYNIEVVGKPGTWARLTVFVAGAVLDMEPGDILVKTWSENKNITDALRNSGLFIDTGRRCPTGFVNAEVWRWKEDK